MEPFKLWLDDKRPAPEGWVHVKTAAEAIIASPAGTSSRPRSITTSGTARTAWAARGTNPSAAATATGPGTRWLCSWRPPAAGPRRSRPATAANPAGKANIESVINSYFGRQLVSSPGEFRLTWREQAQAEGFQKLHRRRHRDQPTAAGGMFTYTFTPTGLGMVSEVSCYCGRKRTLTDFGEW